MKIIYECEYCHKQFNDKHQCETHELLHFNSDERTKYYIHSKMGYRFCEYCANSYLVYGCELDCQYKDCCLDNHFQDFKLKGV